MPRPLIDSEFLFGLHEPGGEELMLSAGRRGWILFCEAIGHDPTDRTGVDFTTFSSRGLGIMCRLNHGYPPDGTIPHSSLYEQFAQRMANFVATSRGCKIWIIGNEMNYAVERPGIQIDWSRHPTIYGPTPEESDPMRRGLSVRFNALPDLSTEIRTTRGAIIEPGEIITPELYARCYRLCREAIHRVPGHEDDQVLVGAVAPWNTQTIYGNNPNGDWVQYFRDILTLLGPDGCDGFTLHTYTHGPDPALIVSDEKLGPPFQQRHREFRAYRDFLEAVPASMRHLPVYITETDQTTPWLDENTGWVQQAYAEIDAWNREPGHQQIRALILYRWPRMDRWYIDGKQGVIEDFRAALQQDYRWQGAESEAKPEPVPEPPGSQGRAGPARPPYRVEWLDDQFPDRLVAGQTLTVPVTLRNAGSLPWSWGGGNPFRVGYRYFRNRRPLSLEAARDLRTDIPWDVSPGETVTVNVRLALPTEPGNYTLELDLVHEGITWFREKGSPVLTRWITVEMPRRALGVDGQEGDQLPVPLFTDVSARLPRSGTPYARRSLSQIRYLVISHTGADPRLSLERIAQTHVRAGYPGMAYHFVVDGEGHIFKVSALEDVANPDQIWSSQGVNICLAGNFSQQTPSMPQLDATGRLCAWLAQNLGLSPQSIMGLGELTDTESPGEPFYTGINWKAILTRQVQLHLAALSGSSESGRVVEMGGLIAELERKQATLADRVAELEAERERLLAFNRRLQGEIAELQRQLEAQPTQTAGGLPIHNWIQQLPRDPERYVPRPADSIQYVVINHTGVAPDVPLEEIARAHLPDWPGILYDYYISAEGEIYQTQPLDQVVETNQVYLARAINIAFAGDFDQGGPTHEQLYAGGKLIAWLLEYFPQLSLESIRGVSEFIDHPSPGAQWLEGACWKEALLAAVRRAAGWQERSPAEAELRSQVAQLEQQVEALRHNNQILQDQNIQLRAQYQQAQDETRRLQGELQQRAQEHKRYVVPKPAMRVVVEQLPRHPTLRYEQRPLSQITHIAIHHTATPPTVSPARIAELHVAPDPARGKDAWPGIGYHFFIHADGTIDQTNYLETASYHVYRHNMYAVGVVFAGSFMNGRVPTTAQLRAGAHLVAWLMQELNIPLARVWGHREFPDNNTVCPGSEWTQGNRWRDMLWERIEQVQSGVGVKTIRHYMLFWQRPYPGPMARQDLVNAISYVVSFRPTIGFSVQDARNAEYVTIVGNEAGISAAEEKLLRASGCKVERIAGRDEEETSRILAELANLGRRFRSFDVDF